MYSNIKRLNSKLLLFLFLLVNNTFNLNIGINNKTKAEKE